MEGARRLREALVQRLERTGSVRSRAVGAALRAVERHRFLPGIDVAQAYADQAIALKCSGQEVLSSISQPAMIAGMLELLEAKPGERILEIGTGSGYHAALLGELVGETGSVTTVELDPEVARQAAETLAALGYGWVRTLDADGSQALDLPPFDRLVVTARSDDLLDAWWDALREGGRLVAPLRFDHAGEYVVAFDRCGETCVGVGLAPCAFIPLRGAAVSDQSESFFRDPDDRTRTARVRRVTAVEAVRRGSAEAAMLQRFDVVLARRATVFGVAFG